MILFRDNERRAEPAALLRACRAGVTHIAAVGGDHAAVTALLIDFGELEAAVIDAAFPAADDDTLQSRAWRAAALRIGDLFRLSWLGGSAAVRPAAAAVLSALDRLSAERLPDEVRLRVPEGYAFYALYPETYLAAAEAFARRHRPAEVVCIGLRSIGASLSAVVAAALQAAGSRVTALTLRPRGHPFDRRPRLSADLALRLRGGSAGHALIVDEGPGLSGSSFVGTADALVELGFAADCIALFPSWPADGHAFLTTEVGQRWRRYRLAWCSFEEGWLSRGTLAEGTPLQDLSAGAWRNRVFADGGPRPPVDHRHERRKYLRCEGAGPPVLYKFAGLGRYGEAALALARRLADAGFTPPVLGLCSGFLAQRWVDGRPLRTADLDADLVATVVRYLAFRRRCTLEAEVRLDPLLEMICVNVGEALGQAWRDRLARLDRFCRLLHSAPAVAVDGRLLPHEWLRTRDGLLKIDAIDHHANHFMPGLQDIAWDVAGFACEFQLSPQRTRELAARVAVATADAALARRLPVYRIAYPAFRLAQVSLSASTLADGPDRRGMAALVRRYRRQLANAIVRLQDAPEMADAHRKAGAIRLRPTVLPS